MISVILFWLLMFAFSTNVVDNNNNNTTSATDNDQNIFDNKPVIITALVMFILIIVILIVGLIVCYLYRNNTKERLEKSKVLLKEQSNERTAVSDINQSKVHYLNRKL